MLNNWQLWTHHFRCPWPYDQQSSPHALQSKEPIDSSLLIGWISNGPQGFSDFCLVEAQIRQILCQAAI